MATLNRCRSMLKTTVLQRLSAAAFHRTTTCSASLQCNRAFHSFNFVKPLQVNVPAVTFIRHYAELPQMTLDQLETRTLHVLKLFDKIDPEKVTTESNFIKDLGLDSLDVVEIIMALEDEFSVEIHDEEADKIATVKDAIELLGDKFDIAE